MIFGIGTDLVDIARFNKSEQQQARLAVKVLNQKEQTFFQAAGQPEAYLAKRFAAKEALAKALGTGVREPVLLTNIAVLNDELGKPYFEYEPDLADFIKQHQITAVHLTLSDTDSQALAFVVIEC